MDGLASGGLDGLAPDIVIDRQVKLVRRLGGTPHRAAWLAEYLPLRRLVAVQVLRATDGCDQGLAAANLAAAMIEAVRVDSPRLCEVYDAGLTSNGDPYVVTELLDGETLEGRIARVGPLPLADCASIIEQIAQGLAAVHACDITYGGVTPSSVFLCSRGGGLSVKLLDLGLRSYAASAADAAVMWREALPDLRQPDVAADIFSLAALAYEMVTGDVPLCDAALGYAGMVDVTINPASELRDSCSSSIDVWFARALHPEPERRFRSLEELAGSFAAALLESASDDPLSSSSPSNRRRRHRLGGTRLGHEAPDGDRARRRAFARELLADDDGDRLSAAAPTPPPAEAEPRIIPLAELERMVASDMDRDEPSDIEPPPAPGADARAEHESPSPACGGGSGRGCLRSPDEPLAADLDAVDDRPARSPAVTPGLDEPEDLDAVMVEPPAGRRDRAYFVVVGLAFVGGVVAALVLGFDLPAIDGGPPPAVAAPPAAPNTPASVSPAVVSPSGASSEVGSPAPGTDPRHVSPEPPAVPSPRRADAGGSPMQLAARQVATRSHGAEPASSQPRGSATSQPPPPPPAASPGSPSRADYGF